MTLFVAVVYCNKNPFFLISFKFTEVYLFMHTLTNCEGSSVWVSTVITVIRLTDMI